MVLYDDLEGWREAQEGKNIYILISDSWCCTAETKATLEGNSSPIENDGDHLELSG